MMRQSLEPGFARMPGQVIFVMFPFIILNICLHAFTIFVTSLNRTRRHGERKTNRQHNYICDDCMIDVSRAIPLNSDLSGLQSTCPNLRHYLHGLHDWFPAW